MDDHEMDNEMDNEIHCYFRSKDGLTIEVKKTDLANYPDSYLTCLSKRTGWADDTGKYFQTSFNNKTLNFIANFYKNGKWHNPYLNENRMYIEGIDDNFEKQCEFLGLPSDEFEEIDEDNDIIDTSYQEDDFYPYEDQDDDDDYLCEDSY